MEKIHKLKQKQELSNLLENVINSVIQIQTILCMYKVRLSLHGSEGKSQMT